MGWAWRRSTYWAVPAGQLGGVVWSCSGRGQLLRTRSWPAVYYSHSSVQDAETSAAGSGSPARQRPTGPQGWPHRRGDTGGECVLGRRGRILRRFSLRYSDSQRGSSCWLRRWKRRDRRTAKEAASIDTDLRYSTSALQGQRLWPAVLSSRIPMRIRVMGPRLGFVQGIGPGQIQLDKGREVGYSVDHPPVDGAIISGCFLSIDAGRQTVEHRVTQANSPGLARDGRFSVGTGKPSDGPWQQGTRQGA